MSARDVIAAKLSLWGYDESMSDGLMSALTAAGFSFVHKDEIHAPSVERAIAVLNECGGKPCGPAELWTDEQRKFYDAGQMDATSSSAAALRELMKEVG